MRVSGKVYSCGWNHKGQLGIGNTFDQVNFQQIQLPYIIKSIFSSWDTSAAISDDGHLFVWGNNSFFNIGCENCLLHPTRINLPCNESVLKVSIEFNYYNILTIYNNVYRIKKGSKAISLDHALNQSHLKNCVLDIASGQNHTLCFMKNHQIIGFGDNKYNQGAEIKLSFMVQKILCGWKFNAILDKNGDLYMWGRNNYGQLSNNTFSESEKEPTRINIKNKIIDFHLGSEHGICFDSEKIAYTWGWNEHGNCGNGNTFNV